MKHELVSSLQKLWDGREARTKVLPSVPGVSYGLIKTSDGRSETVSYPVRLFALQIRNLIKEAEDGEI